MRVRIQYGVELDEVPETVSSLIEDEASLLSWCSHTIDEICSALVQEEPNVKFALSRMDKVRQKLGSLDARLVDMEALLQGYESAMNPPVPQQTTPVNPTTEPQSSLSGKIDPETGAYDYERPYSIPTENSEDTEDEEVDYQTPYEVPKESTK